MPPPMLDTCVWRPGTQGCMALQQYCCQPLAHPATRFDNLHRVVRCRSLGEETSSSGVRSGALRQALGAEDTAANAGLYLLLRAVDRFCLTYQRYPGVYDRWGRGWERGLGWGGVGVGAGAELGRGGNGSGGRSDAKGLEASNARQRGLAQAGCLAMVPCMATVFHALALWWRSEVEEDAALLKSTASALLAECGAAGASVPDDLVAEVGGLWVCVCPAAWEVSRSLAVWFFEGVHIGTGAVLALLPQVVRWGAGELQCVAAIMGAIASQVCDFPPSLFMRCCLNWLR